MYDLPRKIKYNIWIIEVPIIKIHPIKSGISDIRKYIKIIGKEINPLNIWITELDNSGSLESRIKKFHDAWRRAENKTKIIANEFNPNL